MKLQLICVCLILWWCCISAKTNTTVAPSATNEKEALKNPSEDNAEVDTSFAFLLLLIAMLLTFFLGHLIEATRFEFLHEAGVGIILGMAIGALVRYTSSGDKMKTIMVFDQQTFFFLLLPPIIFESGYNMKRGNFFYNMGSICLFAFVGTIVSTMVIGGGIFLTSGILGWGGNLTLIESFLFGALISATDPVTTLAIFSALKVQKNLYADVFGESVLNDAVAIIFYRTLLRFLKEEFQATTLAWAAFDFAKVFFGSLIIAVLIGLLSALLFKHIDLYKHPILEMLLVILYAFATYLLAEGLQLSGIVAILFVGITMAHYTFGNLSKESQIVTKRMFKVVATLTETTVFIYLGLAIFSFESNTEFSFGLIACALPILGISRALNVFPLAAIINCCRVEEHKIPFKHQVMLWFSGLRGAIAFALALDVPTTGEKVIFTTTLIIVLFTVLIMGALTIPMLKYLKIEMGGHNTAPKENKNDHERQFAESSWFMRVDRHYLKPFFTKTAQGQIMHRSSGTVRSSIPLAEIKTVATENSGETSVRISGSDRNSTSDRNSNVTERKSTKVSAEYESEPLQSGSSLDDLDNYELKKKKKGKKKEKRASKTMDFGGYGLGIPPPTDTSFGESDNDDSSDDDDTGLVPLGGKERNKFS